MHVTMVKKRLENGGPCRKCAQAEELLRNRGFWERIDEVVWADETDPDSAGMKLGAEYGVKVAPFFIVRQTQADEPKVYKSVLQFIKEQLAPKASQTRAAASPASDQEPLEQAAARLADAEPEELLRWGLSRFGADCAIAFSGAEDVVLIDMAIKTGLPFSVFCLDTGRLHSETYKFIDRVRTLYGIEIELFSPQAEPLQDFVRKKGLFSFYDDGHKECCGVRKVEPLRRALSTRPAWITGQRKDQSVTRVELQKLHVDEAFSGRDGELVKLNPLAEWSSSRVWRYIRDNDVPYNELHDHGFISIGCEPCTRAVRPGEHERAGRWWWEEETKRECGLHVKD